MHDVGRRRSKLSHYGTHITTLGEDSSLLFGINSRGLFREMSCISHRVSRAVYYSGLHVS